jgi:hypothetical protein
MVPISPSTRRKAGRGLLATALVGLMRRPGRAAPRDAREADTSEPTRCAPESGTGPASRAAAAVAPRRPEAERSGPVLRWTDGRTAPKTGAFAPCAVANEALTSEQVPTKGESWDRCHEFALTYDGYAYWDNVAELAQGSLARWVRDGSLPGSLDELRACLFYEQRRWHHFGDVPSGRSLDYGWALTNAIRALVTPAAPISDATPVRDAALVPAAEPGGASVTVLHDTTEFSAWAAGHPDGYVLNTPSPSPGRAGKIHRVGCPTIATGSTRSTGSGDLPKKEGGVPRVCAPDVPSLMSWARAQTGPAPDPCKRCKP